jgi:hypothetical protein
MAEMTYAEASNIQAAIAALEKNDKRRRPEGAGRCTQKA